MQSVTQSATQRTAAGHMMLAGNVIETQEHAGDFKEP